MLAAAAREGRIIGRSAWPIARAASSADADATLLQGFADQALCPARRFENARLYGQAKRQPARPSFTRPACAQRRTGPSISPWCSSASRAPSRSCATRLRASP